MSMERVAKEQAILGVRGMLHRRVVLSCLVMMLSILPSAFVSATEKTCERPMIFFDIGETLVNTTTHKYNPSYFLPGAHEYLRGLHAHGHALGIIADVPERFGRDNPDVSGIRDYLTAKIVRLKSFMEGHYPDDKTSWQGPVFDWSLFGHFEGSGENLQFRGPVFLPLTDSEQKKKRSRAMFNRAYLAATEAGCIGIYLGEEEYQMDLARDSGLVPFWVGHTLPDQFFLPVERIDEYVRMNPPQPPKPMN